MAHVWADLRALSDDELIAEHDVLAKTTVVGTRHYIDELRYRQQARVASQIKNLTWVILGLTGIVTIATIVNVAVAIVQWCGLGRLT